MDSLDSVLAARLADFEARSLRRDLRRITARSGTRVGLNGRELLNFSSNDYLGLSRHPALVEAAAHAARDWGAGSTASRLVCGSLEPHHRLEEALAAWNHTEAALTFSTGFAAATATIPALVGKDDIVLLDKLTHACCVDAARASGATLRVFHHNDPNDLADLLRWADSRGAPRRPHVLIVTESVFSMDGDVAPLREIVELKRRHGAWLFLDEAHATGLLGPTRAGLAESLGLQADVDLHMGTLGKALGAAGGFIAGSRRLAEFLVHAGRGFVFSTAPVPAAVAAAAEGVRIAQSPEGALLASSALENARELARLLPDPIAPRSAIIPWILGDETSALARAATLLESGILAPAIRYPTVPRGRARIRFTVSAAHTRADLDMLRGALGTSPGPAPQDSAA